MPWPVSVDVEVANARQLATGNAGTREQHDGAPTCWRGQLSPPHFAPTHLPLIVFGEDVRDWWFRADEKETSRGKVAWKGDNELAKSYECRLRLYLTTLDNPTPDRKIVSIDYIGKKDETVAAPFCVAISLEEK